MKFRVALAEGDPTEFVQNDEGVRFLSLLNSQVLCHFRRVGRLIENLKARVTLGAIKQDFDCVGLGIKYAIQCTELVALYTATRTTNKHFHFSSHNRWSRPLIKGLALTCEILCSVLVANSLYLFALFLRGTVEVK